MGSKTVGKSGKDKITIDVGASKAREGKKLKKDRQGRKNWVESVIGKANSTRFAETTPVPNFTFTDVNPPERDTPILTSSEISTAIRVLWHMHEEKVSE